MFEYGANITFEYGANLTFEYGAKIRHFNMTANALILNFLKF